MKKLSDHLLVAFFTCAIVAAIVMIFLLGNRAQIEERAKQQRVELLELRIRSLEQQNLNTALERLTRKENPL